LALATDAEIIRAVREVVGGEGYQPRACRHRQADINSITAQILVAVAPKGHAWPCIGLLTWRLCVGIEAAFVRQNPYESGEGSVSRSATIVPFDGHQHPVSDAT
jgi:hypothetical protein